MTPIQLRLAGAALSCLLIFLSGYWLNRLGAPYSTAVLTIHKLIALAVLLFLGVTAYRRHQVLPLGTVEWIALMTAVLLFVGTIASGGLLSTGKDLPAAVPRLHQVTPFLTLLATAAALYLLLSKAAVSVALLN